MYIYFKRGIVINEVLIIHEDTVMQAKRISHNRSHYTTSNIAINLDTFCHRHTSKSEPGGTLCVTTDGRRRK